MAKTEDIRHSILIVSASDQFVAVVKRSLRDFLTIEIRKSGTTARRTALEREFDLVVIQAPLTDESGEDLAIDLSEKLGASVLLVTPQEVFDEMLDRVTDHGIMVLPSPSPGGRIDQAIRFLVALQNRMYGLKKKAAQAEEKMEEIRLVSKAKLLLVEKKKMTEDEAHRFIGKQAMNNGVSRARIARKILEDF
ncbi:MAG: response regulator [Lachnospiraceae bacterium]|nr:response regulator [Lachnospiraceae bacterium]